MTLLLDRFALFYPMRLVGTTFMVIIVTLYAWHLHRFNALYDAIVAIAIVYPHVVHHLARKYPQNRRNIELRTFAFDSFLVGIVVHAIGLAPLPTFVLITVALASSLSVDGLRQMLISAACVTAGIVAFALLEDVQVGGGNIIAIDIASSVFTFVYFMAFAYSAYNRSALLLRSETALRERTASLEIEKLRSDRLLYNLIPAGLAPHMSTSGGVRPTRFDPVVLVAIEPRGVSRALKTHPGEDVLGCLMHCFKAFDAVAERFGFEKLKTWATRTSPLAVCRFPARVMPAMACRRRSRFANSSRILRRRVAHAACSR